MKASSAVAAILAEAGFEATGSFSASELRVREEVRAMCSADRCQAFGRSWTCPPACGSLKSMEESIGRFKDGFVFQTVAQLEDQFDVESMLEAERIHKERTLAFNDRLAEELERPDFLLLAAGTCTLCRPCAYPKPCIHPDRRLVSMEAAGLVVTEVCTAAGIPYNHGPLTIAYSSCVLV